jgi:DNA-binding transcriptional regulator GbsR (MarR family)
MTEPSAQAAKSLFIRRWGEMAASWGVGRTLAEIHALLFLSSEPQCTDDVMEQLAVSRGSASTNLRELVNWGLIFRVHRRGDRKEYFDAEKDVWAMFETIFRERRRREVQPIVETIQRCLEMIDAAGTMTEDERREAGDQRRRYDDILMFCEVINRVFQLMERAGRSGLKPLTETLAALAV